MTVWTTKTNSKIAEITAEIVKDFAHSLDKKCYVFCEDKNTLSLEREIAAKNGGSFNVSVTSLSRYVSSHSLQIKSLSKTGSALAVFNQMSEHSAELKRIKMNNSPRLATSVYRLIAQLKSAKVTPKEIDEICSVEAGAFGSKLKDINVVYAAYEDYLEKNGLTDSNKYFELIPSLMRADENLKGAKVIFAGFSSLTKQIIDVFIAANSVADCDFVVLKGSGSFYTNEIYDKLKSVFPDIVEKRDKRKLLPEIGLIEKYLFNEEEIAEDWQDMKENGDDIGFFTSDKIRILEAATPYLEVENVAKRIRFEVVKHGRRFKDFVIAASNPKAYSEIVTDIFEEYQIPVYVDVKNTMEKHPIVRYVEEILNVVHQKFQIKEVLKLASSRLVCDEEEYSLFERYIYANAVSRSSFCKPFEGEENATCEAVRQRILLITKPFERKMTARQFVEASISSLKLGDVFSKAESLGKELENFGFGEKARVNEQVIARIDCVFDEIENIIGDKMLSACEFRSVLLSAAAATDISILPLYNDVVYLGDFKSAKQREAKVLFCMGMTSDVPDAKQDTALLTDRDLIKMEGYRCVIEPKIKVVNSRERENVGVALMSFSEQLYLSYPLSNASFEPMTKSQIIDGMAKIFNLEIRNKEKAKGALLYESKDDIFGYMTEQAGLKTFAINANDFRDGKNDGARTMSAFFEAVTDNPKAKADALDIMNEEQEEKLNGDVVKRLSASVIESYFACPYSCFAKYNLKLQEDENGEAQAFEFGNILHEILEKFVSAIDTVKDKESSDNLSGKLFDEIINKPLYARYLNKSRYVYLFSLLKKETLRRCWTVFCEFKNSMFKPIGEEIVFGELEGAKYDAIKLKTPYGEKLISGKVDRVDKYANYIRVIDYKTGSPDQKIKEERLYSGSNIQLFLYSNAFLDNNTNLAGAYYYRVDDSFQKKDETKQTFVGKTLFDEDIAMAMDLRLQNVDESPELKLKFKTKNGERILQPNTSTLSDKELNSYAQYAKRVSENGATELCEGNIVRAPFEEACEHCPFGGMCGYDAEVEFRTRSLSGISKNTIIDALEDDDDE